MRFISGLKSLSKRILLLIIVILFIISWFLFTLSINVIPNNTFRFILISFIGFLAGFTFVLLILSLFFNIDKRGKFLVIIALILTIPVMFLFSGIIGWFFSFCVIANLVLTAFFAFKFCRDSSIKIDDYLYNKKGSRKFTRIIEFLIFGLLSWWFVSITIRYFRSFSEPGIQRLAQVFFVLFLIHLVLIGFVLIRLIFIQKLAAFISLFNLLTFFYVVYLLVSLWADFIFIDSVGYDFFSFFVDLLLFIYIIGSIYDRVDYIKKVFIIFGADTIALFLILMKLIVQIINIIQEFTTPSADLIIGQVQILWIFFAIFTLLVGIYTIFRHKEGKG